MVRAKTLQKKSPIKKIHVLKVTQNRLERFFKRLAGKELAIGITIGFVLMSFLMLFANNLKISQTESEGTSIHAAADLETDAMPGIGQ